LADAVAVSTVDDVTAPVRLLKAQDAGRATLFVASPGAPTPARPTLPEGARWALDVVRSSSGVRPALERALGDVVFVPDLDRARDLVAAQPNLRAVTPDGDVVGAWAAAGGSAKAQSYIEVQAAVDEARQRRSEAASRLEGLRAQLEAAQDEVAGRESEVAAAAEARKQADGQRNSVARQLAELGAAAKSVRAEADRLAAAWANA